MAGCAGDAPFLLHVLSELGSQLDGAAVVAKHQTVGEVQVALHLGAVMPEFATTRPACEVGSQSDARQPDLLEVVCCRVAMWCFGRHERLHGFESAFIRDLTAHATRQAHTERPFRLLALMLALLLCATMSVWSERDVTKRLVPV